MEPALPAPNETMPAPASPSLRDFRALARTHSLVPVVRTLTADLETPVSAYLRITRTDPGKPAPEAFLLESVEGGEHVGRHTFIGIEPYQKLIAHGTSITHHHGRRTRTFTGDIFDELKRSLAGHTPAQLPGLPPFTAGAVGFFAYDVVRLIESLPSLAADELHVPDAVLMFFDQVLAFDHVKKEIHLIVTANLGTTPASSPKGKSNPSGPGGPFTSRSGVSGKNTAGPAATHDHGSPGAPFTTRSGLSGKITAGKPTTAAIDAAYARAIRRLNRLEKLLAQPLPAPARRKAAAAGPLKLTPRTTRAAFLKSVRKTQDYITAGDIFQCVLSQRFDCTPAVDPFQIYRALRIVNPSPYMYFLQIDNDAAPTPFFIVGSSPELLVRVHNRSIEYRPIAGTRPRSADEAQDRAFEADLRADAKEIAEHVMLVDLGRNDVGRVSTFGSVQVKQLMTVERYSHVMHLVSALEGTLRPELDAIDALKSCFPAGTLSGAPKIRAMEIIEELEPARRGVYGGAILYADFSGNLDSCIAIRTLFMNGPKGHIQAGAGIVADSVPEAEYTECLNKSRAVVRAIERARQL